MRRPDWQNPHENRGPAARPPAGRIGPWRGPLCFTASGTGRYAGSPSARPRHKGSGVSCRYRRRSGRGLAARAVPGGSASRSRVPELRNCDQTPDLPAKGSVGGAWRPSCAPAWRYAVGPVLTGSSVESCRFRTPPRSGLPIRLRPCPATSWRSVRCRGARPSSAAGVECGWIDFARDRNTLAQNGAPLESGDSGF
jgi:hypothetical protein